MVVSVVISIAAILTIIDSLSDESEDTMTLKYISILDYDIVKGIYEYCHVPIDNIIINQVEYNFFNKAWSKINSYEEYYKFQKRFKKKYGSIPLDEEFKLYINCDN